jgi:hypothetical protein
MNDDDFEDFVDPNNFTKLPQSLVDKLYSLTGDTEKYKGLFLVYISANGDPVVFSKFGEKAAESAAFATAKDFLNQIGLTQFQSE